MLRRRRRRGLLAGFAAVATVATVLAILAYINMGRANNQADLAAQEADNAQEATAEAVAQTEIAQARELTRKPKRRSNSTRS